MDRRSKRARKDRTKAWVAEEEDFLYDDALDALDQALQHEEGEEEEEEEEEEELL